jgi:hypothetical protein
MILYWKKQSAWAWEHFSRHNVVDADTKQHLYPESVKFMRNFYERHIPIPDATLEQWSKEADICGSTYGASLKVDIKWAKKCNQLEDEVLLFLDKAIATAKG